MRYYLFLLLTLFSSGLFAQQTEYLFNRNSNFRIGGFGGPNLQLAMVNNELAVYTGGSGAAIFNGGFFYWRLWLWPGH